MARIIPVSSGKGGVGKTTFAIHYALMLSRYGRTILIDLDMGTSSVRNSIDVSIPYDLYHFFRRGKPLQDCVSTLDDRIDPHARFSNFGFIASPRGLIEELLNFDDHQKVKLISAINSLPVDYVVIDLKAGIDPRVLDFLPHANTGVVVFTPLVPSAIFAASEMVKALILRKLKALFTHDSFMVRSGLSRTQIDNYAFHIACMEDVYEASEQNMEEFLALLQQEVSDELTLGMLRNVVRDFKIYYVLNRFNSITESVDKIIRPFTDSIHRAISPHLKIINLGWIVEDERFLKSAGQKIPLLLQPNGQKPSEKKVESDALNHWMTELKREFGRVPRPARMPPATQAGTGSSPNLLRAAPASNDPLEQQLSLLKAMFDSADRNDYRLNFDYITQRTLHLMRHSRFDDFGDIKLLATLQERADAVAARWH